MPFLHLKDTELYYEVHGRGQPMVFLSETACDGEVWKLYQVEEFSRDHQVILHDYRGTGRSGKPSIEYSTKMFCDDAAALMDHLGVEKAIVDRSFDGRQDCSVAGAGISGQSGQINPCVHRCRFPGHQRASPQDLPRDDRVGL